jgi:hypothetical protein
VENQIRSENGLALRTAYGKIVNYENGQFSGEGRALVPGTQNISQHFSISSGVGEIRLPFIYGVNTGL